MGKAERIRVDGKGGFCTSHIYRIVLVVLSFREIESCGFVAEMCY